MALVNPPGSKRYLRDCYCGSIDKAGYYWQPFDLVVQSGWLSQVAEVSLLDAIIEGLDPPAALAHLHHRRPEVIVALTSLLSWSEDVEFLRRAKQETGAALFVSGDWPRFQASRTLAENPFIDGVLLDLTTPDLATFVREGRLPPGTSVTHRDGEDIIDGRLPGPEPFAYPLPSHDMFFRRPYRFALPLPEPVASTVGMHGCPYRCDFCNTGMIHFAPRDEDNLAEELAWLHAQHVPSLQLREATFNWSDAHVERFCELLLQKEWRFQWFCFARPDKLSPAQIKLMARAGCRYVGFGIETGDRQLLGDHKDRYEPAVAAEAIRACRRHGIQTVGHFILGLPGETEGTLEKTRRLALSLPLDFASFNLFAPRPGAGLLGESIDPFSPGSQSYAAELDYAALESAQARMMRSFYFRVGYILRRLAALRDWQSLRQTVRQGWRIIRAAVRR
ncbi:MAG: radical SAM protein [Candidatus Lernaella stagnicola]|nr:radical SAM protein [Candidatus Lernaella stagnicola]